EGKPAQVFRLFRKIHPKQVVTCQITATGDATKARELGEATLNSMTSLLPPEPVPAPPPPPVARTRPPSGGGGGGGVAEEKRNQRAQAALEQAKKLADAGKDDDAYAKYRYVLS